MPPRKTKGGLKDFGSDSESDDKEDDFQSFLKKRSIEVQKKTSLAYEKHGDIEEEERDERKEVMPTESRFISGFLKSKRQRELDKMALEALDIENRRKLEEDDEKTENYVTEGYKRRKNKLKEASRLDALEAAEENKHIDRGIHSLTAQLFDEASKDESKVGNSSAVAEMPRDTKSTSTNGNDIYIPNPHLRKTSKHKIEVSGNTSVSKVLTPTNEVVAEFLQAKRTKLEIARERDAYFRRTKES